MTQVRVTAVAAALAALCTAIPAAAETKRPTEDAIREAARAYALTLPQGTCPTSDQIVTIEAGKAYFGCKIDAVLVYVKGTGATSIANSTITGTMFKDTSTGDLDLSVSRLKATLIDFAGGGKTNLEGAHVDANRLCGTLAKANMSGVTLDTTSISLDMRGAELEYATIKTTSFQSGSIEGAHFFETEANCTYSNMDLSPAKGMLLGTCRQAKVTGDTPSCW